MLQTNLKHIMTANDHKKFIEENENVMICCGRIGPMCIPVYIAMKTLEGKYKQIKFADMEFDSPESHVIRNAPECKGFMGLPFTVYYKKGKLVKATTSIQSTEQISSILNNYFPDPSQTS
jgi:thioredoxin 1